MLDENDTPRGRSTRPGNSLAMGLVVVLVAAVMVPTILVLASYYWLARTLRATSHKTVAFVLSQGGGVRQ